MDEAAVPVVVAGLLVRARRVLLVHRSPHRRWYPDVWDLPGLEPAEPPAAALVRELHAELGVTVAAGDCDAVAGWPAIPDDPALRLTVLHVRAWTGTPVNRCPEEHDELRWCTAAQLRGLSTADPSCVGLLTAGTGAPDEGPPRPAGTR